MPQTNSVFKGFQSDQQWSSQTQNSGIRCGRFARGTSTGHAAVNDGSSRWLGLNYRELLIAKQICLFCLSTWSGHVTNGKKKVDFFACWNWLANLTRLKTRRVRMPLGNIFSISYKLIEHHCGAIDATWLQSQQPYTESDKSCIRHSKCIAIIALVSHVWGIMNSFLFGAQCIVEQFHTVMFSMFQLQAALVVNGMHQMSLFILMLLAVFWVARQNLQNGWAKPCDHVRPVAVVPLAAFSTYPGIGWNTPPNDTQYIPIHHTIRLCIYIYISLIYKAFLFVLKHVSNGLKASQILLLSAGTQLTGVGHVVMFELSDHLDLHTRHLKGWVVLL